MIKSIKFKKDDSKTNYGYVNRLPSIEKLNGQIEFKPGLNIIVGPNGSGKSSILTSIANHLGANQSGYSVITKKWLQDIDWDSESSEIETIVSPVDIEHDGQPIVFGDPRRRAGLTNSGIDEEFYGEGLLEHINMSQESSGEQNNRRITPYLEILQNKIEFPTNFVDSINVNNINSLWKNRFNEVYHKWLSGNIPLGQPTILLDEPESGLGLMNQILLWNKILKSKKIAEKFQIILVSHSLECLNIDHANYIELRSGYLNACQKLAKGEIKEEEAAKYASNIQRELTNREIDVLKKVRLSQTENSPGYPVGRSVKTCENLEKIDFLEQRSFIEKDKTKRRGFGIDMKYVYILTEKAKQFLDMHM